jgi:hypothetical protein
MRAAAGVARLVSHLALYKFATSIEYYVHLPGNFITQNDTKCNCVQKHHKGGECCDSKVNLKSFIAVVAAELIRWQMMRDTQMKDI